MSKISKVKIFSEAIIHKNGEFDEEICHNILGDYYDNFIKLCEQLKESLTDVKCVNVVGFKPVEHKATFEVQFAGGKAEEIEI